VRDSVPGPGFRIGGFVAGEPPPESVEQTASLQLVPKRPNGGEEERIPAEPPGGRHIDGMVIDEDRWARPRRETKRGALEREEVGFHRADPKGGNDRGESVQPSRGAEEFPVGGVGVREEAGTYARPAQIVREALHGAPGARPARELRDPERPPILWNWPVDLLGEAAPELVQRTTAGLEPRPKGPKDGRGPYGVELVAVRDPSKGDFVVPSDQHSPEIKEDAPDRRGCRDFTSTPQWALNP